MFEFLEPFKTALRVTQNANYIIEFITTMKNNEKKLKGGMLFAAALSKSTPQIASPARKQAKEKEIGKTASTSGDITMRMRSGILSTAP